MKIKDQATVEETISLVKSQKGIDICVATEFGVVTIGKKEAVRILETCEYKTVYLSFSAGQLILEWGE